MSNGYVLHRVMLFNLFFILYCATSFSQVLICTYSYNRPDFIEIQNKAFKKFLKDEYEFIVFNDARDLATERAIYNICASCGIRCIRIPQEIHTRPYLKPCPGDDIQNAARRCANVVQYSLDTIGFDHNGIVAIIDSDMFLVKPFSIVDYMDGYDLSGVYQVRGHVEYLWNGLVFFNMISLPNRRDINFNCGCVDNIRVDVGGYTYYYLQANKDARVKFFYSLYINFIKTDDDQWLREHFSDQKARAFLKKSPPNIEFILNDTFLHYRSGTNWDRKSAEHHKLKTKLVNEYIHDVLSD